MKNGIKGFIIFVLLIIIFGLVYYMKYIKVDEVINIEVEAKLGKQYQDRDYIIDTDYSNDDIRLPYFNVNSIGSNDLNFKIKKLYDSIKDKYNISVNYEKYTYDNIIFVVVSVIEDESVDYYTYNIELKNGKELKYDSVYKLLGLNNTEIEDKIFELYSEDERLEEIIGKYRSDVKNESIKYYVDNSLHLIVLVSDSYEIINIH